MVTAGGPSTIVVSGSRSTCQSYSAGRVVRDAVRVDRADVQHVLAVRRGPCSSCGDEQATNGPPSSAHSNVEPAWSDENSNVALVFAVSDTGPRSIVVSGRATIAPLVPLRRRRRGCPPRRPRAPRRVLAERKAGCSCTDSPHGSNGAPSSEHSNVASCSLVASVKFAKSFPVTAGGPNVIVVVRRRVVGDRPRVGGRHRIDDRVDRCTPGPGTCAPRTAGRCTSSASCRSRSWRRRASTRRPASASGLVHSKVAVRDSVRSRADGP